MSGPGKLGRADVRFLVVCAAILVAGAAVVRAGFSRAFPEAAIDFRVTRDEAVTVASKELETRGFALSGFKGLAIFGHDEDAKVYLERTLGLSKANEAFASSVPVWRWEVRFVKELERLEYRAYVSPAGRVIAFRRVLPEKQAAPDPGEPEARRRAEETLLSMRGLSAADVTFVDVSEEKRESRVDRTYAWRSNRVRYGDGALKYLVEVQGDRVSRSSTYFEVPDAFRKDYQVLRSQNETASAVASFGLFLTAFAILVSLVSRIRRHDVPWRLALTFGLVGVVLQLAASLNELPLSLQDYDTTDTWTVFVGKTLLGGLGGAVSLGLVVTLLVAAGEPLYRERYPNLPALGRVFSPSMLGTRSVFRGLVLGYTMTAAFVAYQVTFYVVAEKLGAWAPLEVPYSNLLGTSLPWLGVLLMGFLPATTEEFSSRLFSIPFLEGFVPRWAAVVIPALIWGFAHSAYPNQPFFIRGVEVGLGGIAIGVVMLRFGILPLLVWHFTVDAVYTALVLVRSPRTYFVVSGLLAALVLLLPLLVSVVLYLRRGGFASEDELSNGSVGSAPVPEKEAASPRFRLTFTPDTVDRGLVLRLLVLAVAVVALVRLALPHERLAPSPTLDRSSALRVADAFVVAQGDDAGRYVRVATLATALPRHHDGSDDEASPIPYGWSASVADWIVGQGGVSLLSRWATSILPGAVWQVRFLRPEDRHGWWVVVSARSGGVVGFRRTLPKEEPGALLEAGAARARAEALLRERGFDPSRLTLVSETAETQKARRDHRLVFETEDAAGGARRRRVVELRGGGPALLGTAVKLPEDFLRARERTTYVTYLGVGIFVLGFGTLVGLFIFELGKAVRAGRVPWRGALVPALVLTIPTLARQLVSLPQLFRAYPDPPLIPLPLFAVTSFIGLAAGLVLTFGAAYVVCALVLAVRPDAVASFRREAPGGAPAVARALVAAAIVIAAKLLSGAFPFAFPLEVGLSPELPFGVESLLPCLDSLESGVRLALVLAAIGALGALLLQDLMSTALARGVMGAILLGAAAPIDPRTLPELGLATLASALVPVALVAAVAVALRGEPRAYLLAGLFVTGLGHGGSLLASDVTWWTVNGAVLIVAPLLLSVWFAFRRRPL